eukprot:jgi/Antlo1/368/298
MVLVCVKKGNTIIVAKPCNMEEYEKMEAVDVQMKFESFFVDRYNRLFVLADGYLYVLEGNIRKLDTKKIEFLFPVNTDTGCRFYYTSGRRLYLKTFESSVEGETLVREFEHDVSGLLVTRLHDVCSWYGCTFTIFGHGFETTESVPFAIKSIQSNADKYAIFDIKNNIYIYNLMKGKLEGGLKSMGSDVVACASSKFMPLVAVSMLKNVVVLDTDGKRVFKTIDVESARQIAFTNERTLLILGDKLWVHDLLTDETYVGFDDTAELFSYVDEHDGFHIKTRRGSNSGSNFFAEVAVEDKIQETFLRLKTDMVKELFSVRKELDELWSFVKRLESSSLERA